MDYDTHFKGLASESGGAAVDSDEVEIATRAFRLSGRLVLGSFRRLSDLFNHSLGYVVIRDARILQASGEATHLDLLELMIKREEITYVGQVEAAIRPRASGSTGALSAFDRPTMSKVARRIVFYLPVSTVTTNVHMLEEMTLSTLLDGREPRFIPTTGARVRSLPAREVVGEFGLLLLNREHIAAAAEAALAGAAAD